MKQASLENIYSEIMLLSNFDREKLYNRMKTELYQSNEIVAYTTSGEALTMEQYKKRINLGIEQCIKGESIGLEDLTKDLGYNYVDL
jgi:hypothetical protein